MIKVSVFYPYGVGKRFDMTYYLNQHIPLVRERLGEALRSVAVEEGVAGEEPGSTPAFVAMCHLGFESVEAFQQAFGPHAEAIVADIPNYTDIEPTLQLSAVRL